MASNSDDIVNVQRGVVSGGVGDDTFIISSALIDDQSSIIISDTNGSNKVQLIAGLTISSSVIANNTLELSLSNGAVVTVLDASSMVYVTGGDPYTTDASGTEVTYSQFADTVLGAAVPDEGSGIVTGTTVNIIEPDGPKATPLLTVTEQQLRDAVSDGSYAIEDGGITYTFENSQYNIDTSNVTNMSSLFAGTTEKVSNFNGDIGYWDTSGVTDMSRMFHSASTFNQDIGQWDTASVTDMNGMFDSAKAFNQDISQWNTSNVTDMNAMFAQANTFNQSIGQWDTASVTDMSAMFFYNEAFNQDISQWNTSSVTDMEGMFYWNPIFAQDLSSWSVEQIMAKPNGFDLASSLADHPDWQPQWGLDAGVQVAGIESKEVSIDWVIL